MANPTIDIVDLVRKRFGEETTDFLQDALSAFLHALMEAEVNTQAGAAYGERSDRPFRKGRSILLRPFAKAHIERNRVGG